jgi:glycosyltransferase involved in cell wall biosynthesis
MTQPPETAGRLLVLIPAYNEEENLSQVIAGVRDVAPQAVILIVDDCSRDATSRTARLAGARVVRHPVNLGYGSALLTGYRYADRHGFARLVQMDGDGQHDPSSIGALVAALDSGADLVLGSRFGPGVRRYRPPRLRAAGMWFFGRIVTRALGKKITDPTSGFQGLSGRLVRFHARGDHFPADYPDADILILVGRAGFRVTEVPVTMYEKPGGASIHSGLKPIYYVIKMVLSILLVLTSEPKRPPEEVPCP